VARREAVSDEDRIAALELRRANYIAYIEFRLQDRDWHGVMDAAADLREIDTELRVLREVER
jgi:hypothetical protein